MAPSPIRRTNEDESHRNQWLKKESELVTGDEIVISGISGIFPKSNNVEEFMNNLYDKVDMVTNHGEFWQFNHPQMPKYSGRIQGFDKFDAHFFRVPTNQAEYMDAMTKKLLENAYGALFDAGVSPDCLAGTKVGVFVGSTFSDIIQLNMFNTSSDSKYLLTGSSKTMQANRISYWLDGKGTSYGIDNSYGSSITALEEAFWSIKTGRCDSAIVGGANQLLYPNLSLNLRRKGLLCLDGKTRCFDKHADGFVRSESVSVLFLQRASVAKRIYAEVVHMRHAYLMSPDINFLPIRKTEDIQNLLRSFYSEVNILPDNVEYVEACGTGILEGDANELEAIANIFGNSTPIKVGSVKSNMGHSEGASDVCSITKACLAYHKGKLPGNLHFNEPQDDVVGLSEGRVQIVTETTPFSRGYMAFNSFSFGGMNHHTLMKGHYKKKELAHYRSEIPRLVLASGRLKNCVSKIFDTLKTTQIDAEQIALLHDFFGHNISGHTYRGYTILDINTKEETISLAENIDHYPGTAGPVWFLYSGMGSQWPGMGAELMKIPTFAASIERCHKVLQLKGLDIVKIITNNDETIFENILHSFVGITAMQIGLTDLLREMGIVPDNIIGHSLGEHGCAYADGCFTAEDIILVSYYRGLVSIDTKFRKGLMAAVGLGHEQVSLLCPPEVEVACHNSSESSTISGPAEIVSKFVEHLREQGIFAKEVQTANIAYHSKYIAEAGPRLLSTLTQAINIPKMRSEKWICTSAPPEKWDDEEVKYASAKYFTNNLLNNVYFYEAAKIIPANATIIEISPHGLMQAILKRSHKTNTHISLTNKNNPNPVNFLLKAVGNLYQIGLNPKINILYPKVDYPVSTETPILSQLVGWAHDTDRPTKPFTQQSVRRSSCRNFAMTLDDDDWHYVQGHMRNGAIIFPEAALLVLVWETLAMCKGFNYRNMSVVFESIRFEKELYVKKDKAVTFTISLHVGSFEVFQENAQIASGFVKHLKKPKFTNINETNANEDVILAAKDIYSLLETKGYSYSCGGVQVKDIRFCNKPIPDIISDIKTMSFIPYLYTDKIYERWGRYSYLSADQPFKKNKNIILANNSSNHVDSLTWCEDSNLCGENSIQVSYTGLSLNDYQNASSRINSKNTFGMDFSGYNCRSERVMGLVCSGALASKVEADPNLLWPVPQHWSLQEAATVPLPYALAYYCLNVKGNLDKNENILVLGGAGALGHAVIALCLASNCTVFTTVSDYKKKQYLQKIFPQLKEEFIYCTSDSTSLHASIAYSTKNLLCNYVISCATGEMRMEAMKCVANFGYFMNVNNHDEQENLDFGMFYCRGGRSFTSINLDSIFQKENFDQKKKIYQLISHGITQGTVKPITSSTYSASEISTAFRFLVSNERTGRILINMENITADQKLKILPRISFQQDAAYLIIGCESLLGIELANWLIKRGARNLVLHQQNDSLNSYTHARKESWRKYGVISTVSTRNLENYDECDLLLKECEQLGPVLGIFIFISANIYNDISDSEFISKTEIITKFDAISRKKCLHLRDFVIISDSRHVEGDDVTISAMTRICELRNENNLPGFVVQTQAINQSNASNNETLSEKLTKFFFILENSIENKYDNVISQNFKKYDNVQFLQIIAKILGTDNNGTIDEHKKIKDYNINPFCLCEIRNIVNNIFNIDYNEEELAQFTFARFRNICTNENTKSTEGLRAFYNFIDHDEIQAAEPIVKMSSKVGDCTNMAPDELDSQETYLILIPGFEGHPRIFSSIGEMLKIQAITLQLSPDLKGNSVQEMALELFEQIKKTLEFKSKFYILGYSFGVNIALELAAIMEKQGYLGVIYCLDSSPDAVRMYLEAYLGKLTDSNLQNIIVREIFQLMSGKDWNSLDEELEKCDDWLNKIDLSLKKLKPLVNYSHDYQRAILESLYKRIKLSMGYEPNFMLESDIVLLKGHPPHPKAQDLTDDYNLSKYTKKPVKVFNIETDHPSAPNYCGLANIVNKMLEPELLKKYQNLNLCEFYIERNLCNK